MSGSPSPTSAIRQDYISHLKAMYAAKLTNDIRNKVVEDVMRFPAHRKEARLTYLIKRLDRSSGVNEYDVDDILQKLKTRGVTHNPEYYSEMMRTLQHKYIFAKSRKRRHHRKTLMNKKMGILGKTRSYKL